MPMSSAEKSARYRAKDVDAYRKTKRELARTEHHRQVRRLYMQKWREENREKHNLFARQSYQKHKHKHLERNWKDHIRRKYGITSAEYSALLERQDDGCALCGTTTYGGKGKRLAVDHCHATSRIRGLPCYRCNVNLGVFECWYLKQRDKIDAYLK